MQKPAGIAIGMFVAVSIGIAEPQALAGESPPRSSPAEPAKPANAGKENETPNVINETPLLTAPRGSRDTRRRFYRGEESGTRFFFVPIDSLFREVRQRREAKHGTGGTATSPLTPDGNPPTRTALQKDILRTYDAIMVKGVRLFRDRDYKHAAKEFRRAHVAIRKDVSSRLYLAVTFYAMGDYDEALLVLRQANTLHPAVWALPFDLPAEYEKPKEYEKNLARLERRVKASPPNAKLKMLLAVMYHFSGRSAEAKPLLKKAARRAKDDPLLISLYRAVTAALP